MFGKKLYVSLFWKVYLVAASINIAKSIFCCWCWNTLKPCFGNHDLPEDPQREGISFDSEWHYSKWPGYSNGWNKCLLLGAYILEEMR